MIHHIVVRFEPDPLSLDLCTTASRNQRRSARNETGAWQANRKTFVSAATGPFNWALVGKAVDGPVQNRIGTKPLALRSDSEDKWGEIWISKQVIMCPVKC